jgi:hypothetical protein
MVKLVEPLKPARVLKRPRGHDPLKGFSCGPCTKKWEQHVNAVAGRLYAGEAAPQTTVVLEDATGALVGVCSFLPRDLMLPVYREPLRGALYINMIGTDVRFQGLPLEDGSRPGDALLGGTLELIRSLHSGAMPYVHALVAPKNTRSHALFERHDFGEISPLTKGGDAIRLRAPG